MATNSDKVVRMRLQTLGALLNRTELATRLGQQYGSDRDIYEALGYKTELQFRDYAVQYERQDIAKAIIDRPVQATWQGGVDVLEMEDDEETEFEKAYASLNKRLLLVDRFVRLDKLATLGRYGVLLLGFDDVKTRIDLAKEVSSGKRELLYVKPLSEGSAVVSAWETNTGSERYGLPTMYSITLKLPVGGNDIVSVHHSRVMHVPGELLESEVEGVPYLRAVYNRLCDLEKLVGSSAEMFWRGARPGYQASVREGYQMSPTAQDDLQDQIDEYEHKLRRILAVEGVDFKGLEAQVFDPAAHVDVQIQMISAVTGIPKRILVGSERGELASTEDKSMWLDMIAARRDNYAEPQIVRTFIDRLVKYRVLPEPKTGEYSVIWQDLYAMSEKERVDIAKSRATALKEYVSVPEASSIVPPEAFLQYGLGLADEDIQQIVAIREQYVREEEEAQATEEEEELERGRQEEELQANYNPYRDKRGRFTFKPGGREAAPAPSEGGPAGSVEELLAKIDADPRVQAAEKMIAEAGDSRDYPGVMEGTGALRRYTNAAHAENQRIADSFISPEFKPPVGEAPTATFVFGKPGSGKTTMVDDMKARGDELKPSVMLNSDLVKEKIPGYTPELAAAFHERSCDITRNYLTPAAIAGGYNVCLDATDNEERMLKAATGLKAAGYKIVVLHADVDDYTSVSRVYERFLRTGRYVPARVALGYGDAPTRTYNALKPIADAWRHYDTTKHPPRLVESGNRSSPPARHVAEQSLRCFGPSDGGRSYVGTGTEDGKGGETGVISDDLQVDYNPYHDEEGKFASAAGGAAVGAGATDAEIRAERAKASYVPVNAEKRKIATISEDNVAKSIGGARQPDNAPFDVLSGKVAIEVKTIVVGKNPKITMHKESLARKMAYARKNKVKAYTVAVDQRRQPPVVYVQRGLGSFRLKNMTPVGSYEELAKVIK